MNGIRSFYNREPLTEAERELLFTLDLPAFHFGRAYALLPDVVPPLWAAVGRLHDLPQFPVERRTSAWLSGQSGEVIMQILHHMRTTGTGYWSWPGDAWARLASSDSGCLRHPICAVAYLLGDVYPYRDYPRVDHGRKSHTVLYLTQIFSLVHGSEAWTLAQSRAEQLIDRWHPLAEGLKQSEFRQSVACALLDGRTSCLEELTYEVLLAQKERRTWNRYLVPLSRALHEQGVLPRPLTYHPQRPDAEVWNAVPAEWQRLIETWEAHSLLADSSKRKIVENARRVGRWLAAEHPNVRRPEEWTTTTAQKFRLMVQGLEVGQYIYRPSAVTERRAGEPLAPSTKADLISSIRTFFRDLERLKEIGPLEIDIDYDLALPLSIKHALGPRPRDLERDDWLRVIKACLNLERDDCKGFRAPFEMLRALAVGWAFIGGRINEIRGLTLGCARRLPRGAVMIKTDSGEIDASDIVCYLDVPALKFGPPYTKPVAIAVMDAFEAWERVRPPEPKLHNGKTGHYVDYLFTHRGKRVSEAFLNQKLIPRLLELADVPLVDSKGKVVFHRGRSSLLSFLYNAQEGGIDLEALRRWCNHTSISTTLMYISLYPERDAEKHAAIWASSSLNTILNPEEARLLEQDETLEELLTPLGNGNYCSNPRFLECQQRGEACRACEFFVRKGSVTAEVAEAGLLLKELAANQNLEPVQEQGLGRALKQLQSIVKNSM